MKSSSYRVKFLDCEQIDSVTYYNISITDMNAQKATWFLKHRYREMRKIHEEIASNYDGELPNFPPKKFLGNLDPDFVSQRKKHLENYFNTLLRTINIEKIPLAKNFLFKGRNTSEIHPSNNQNPNIEKGNDFQKKPEIIEKPQTSVLKATGGNFEKIVDLYSNKMADIIDNRSFPEEEEIYKRKKIYSKFSGLKVTGPLNESLQNFPKANEESILFVKKESWVTGNGKFLKEMDKSIALIMEKFEEIESVMNSKTVIHHFQ